MTREQIEAKIEDLKESIFILAMDDHWSRDDYDRDRKMHSELRELEKQLAEM